MSDGVDRRPQANFHPRRATARSAWLVRSVNTGASHHCWIDRAGDSLLGNPRTWVSEAPARNPQLSADGHRYRLGAHDCRQVAVVHPALFDRTANILVDERWVGRQIGELHPP